MKKTVLVATCALMLCGCANLRSPKFVDVNDVDCQGIRSRSLCLLSVLSKNYKDYTNGAQDARTITDLTVVGATGGAAIGAATNAHSNLYKAAGSIALTAMGISTYANFKTQSLATRVAASKLNCASAPLTTLIEKAGLSGASPSILLTTPSLPQLDMTAAGTGLVNIMGKANVATTDYISLANIINTHEAGEVNTDRAKKILTHIDDEATNNMVGLQLAIINEIENDSFKLDEALKVFPAKPAERSNPNIVAKAALGGAPDSVIELNKEAVAIIDTYSRYTRCMSGDFSPMQF